jgi:ATP-dependent DNA ligase
MRGAAKLQERPDRYRLSDQGWRDINERLAKLEVAEKRARVNSTFVPDAWLEPAIVVEVLADEITPSPRHTAGMSGDEPGFALRFPRIVSLRTADKKPEDATCARSGRCSNNSEPDSHRVSAAVSAP